VPYMSAKLGKTQTRVYASPDRDFE
jgi:hypothetical protein